MAAVWSIAVLDAAPSLVSSSDRHLYPAWIWLRCPRALRPGGRGFGASSTMTGLGWSREPPLTVRSHSVMRGLDPRIHLSADSGGCQMDPRVKPAGDGMRVQPTTVIPWLNRTTSAGPSAIPLHPPLTGLRAGRYNEKRRPQKAAAFAKPRVSKLKPPLVSCAAPGNPGPRWPRGRAAGRPESAPRRAGHCPN